MTEKPSDTSNHQRFDEMLLHLTPVGAVIPYSLCFDCDGHIWIASKGGIFKFGDEKELLFERKNTFPKKIAPYCQVLAFRDKIIHVQTDDKAELTEFRVLSLDGIIEHEQFIDGKIQSLTVNRNGDFFMTKQPKPNSDESIIYKTSMDALLGWDELSSSFDCCFQNICAVDEDTLFVATTSIPINMYSKQNLHIIDAINGDIKKTFSSVGKEDGQIFFPRSIQPFNDDVLVLDKTGRIQRFTRNGDYVELSAGIDAYLGNGFVVKDDQAIIACSGIVLDKEGKTLCDDWLEAIRLDGTTWKSK